MAERAERLERVCKYKKSTVIKETYLSHKGRLEVKADIIEDLIVCNISQRTKTMPKTTDGATHFAWSIDKSVFQVTNQERDDIGAMFVNGHWARRRIVPVSNLLTQLEDIYNDW